MLNWIASRRALLTRGALVSVAGLAGTVQAAVAAPQSKNIEIFLTFCKAGQDRDVEKQMTFIDEDSTYHNMPDAEPIAGRAGIRALLSSYVTTTEASEIKVLAYCRNIVRTRVERTGGPFPREGREMDRMPGHERLRNQGRQDQTLARLLRRGLRQ